MTVAVTPAVSKTYRNKMSAHGGNSRVAGISEAELKRRLERVFAQRYLQERIARWRKQSTHSSPQVYKPRMDLYDDPEDPYITAVLELPGVHTEDLRLRIENHFLLIEGHRRGPGVALNATAQPTGSSEDTGDAASADRSELALGSSTVQRNAKVRELRFGQFRRAIELPHGMEASDIQTSLGLGMLTLSWPRNPAGTGCAVKSMAVDGNVRDRTEHGRHASRSTSVP
ncbi:hypothetical protein CERSUDRAFT_114986 [Gelatoporia subvermispora B]|uniref:SHSP domain-containing protein n=1 Tax=Ceriporiopsis subvermispora (strain B) TaxID=914234 RepID=M2RF55_CERS8|nr:hypothetical protein CERSUDRAFT_114986 [Gelatoporia subvermispora B]